MSLHIAGMGWVTPLGSSVPEVWGRLLRGEEAAVEMISDLVGQEAHPVFRVPASALKDLPAHPRLRRASAISRFAAAAGIAALHDAGITIGAPDTPRIALIFAISNGGVIYTKRFYRDIVAAGANTASPLLFPETVFNAPASHLAALLGLTGTSYTLVGDGAVGLLAIRMAEDLMRNDNFDYSLVVGAEEADWLLCDAYSKWRLTRSAPPIEPFRSPAKGMILSEGSGAILMARNGPVKIAMTHAGTSYTKRSRLGEASKKVLRELEAPLGAAVIVSANGTFIDAAEASAVTEVMPGSAVYALKPALGESVGASTLWQVITGAQALQTGTLPPLLHVSSNLPFPLPKEDADATPIRDAVVLGCGLNQQVAGLRLSI